MHGYCSTCGFMHNFTLSDMGIFLIKMSKMKCFFFCILQDFASTDMVALISLVSNLGRPLYPFFFIKKKKSQVLLSFLTSPSKKKNKKKNCDVKFSHALRGFATSYYNNQNLSQNYNVILAKIKMKLKE